MLENDHDIISSIPAHAVKPLYEFMLVQVLDDGSYDKTKSGIVMPKDLHERRARLCKVIAVGPGRSIGSPIGMLELKAEFKPGALIFISRQVGDKVLLQGEEYLILKVNDALCEVATKPEY